MNTTNDEPTAPHTTKWFTFIQARAARLSEALSENPDHEKFLSDEFIKNIADDYKKEGLTSIKLDATNLLLLGLLFSLRYSADAEISIVGVTLKNLGNFRELLYFGSSLLAIYLSLISIHMMNRLALLKWLAAKKFPTQVRENLSVVYHDTDVLGSMFTNPPYGKWGRAAFSVRLVYSSLALCLICGYVLITSIIKIIVLADIFSSPQYPGPVHNIVVLIGVMSLLFSFVSALVIWLPWPYRDRKNLEKFMALEKSVPEKYKIYMRRWAEEESKAELRRNRFDSLLYSLLSIFGLLVITGEYESLATTKTLILLATNCGLAYVYYGKGVNWLNKFSRHKFLKKSFSNADIRLRTFERMEIIIAIRNVLIPLAIGVMFYIAHFVEPGRLSFWS